MSDTDWELLARYARHHAEDAFAELVRRHLDLVHSAALRQVRSPQLAEEVAQSAFLKLAQHARQLAPGTVLSAWLYQVTRREAIDVVRREARRQLREQTASEMNVMNATAADWTDIEPLLDEAMHALDETDRTAVLLRYFENKSLREVGQALGASENAAQKRLTRAVERLREFFARHGVSVGASGLAVSLSANAVHAAPVGLAATISYASALAGKTLVNAATVTATKTIAMTTLQKSLIGATLAVAVGTGIYEARQASASRSQLQTILQQQGPLAQQIEQLNQDRDSAASKLAALQDDLARLRGDNERLRRDAADLAKLRGEVSRLRAVELQAGQAKADAVVTDDPFTQSVLVLTQRAGELNGHLQRMPEKKIPELQLLTENDWLSVAKAVSLQSEPQVRQALAKLRNTAKHKFATYALNAVDKFATANNGQMPTDLSQIKPYFEVPVDDAMLQRYQVLQPAEGSSLQDDWVMGEKVRVDPDYDMHLYKRKYGKSVGG
jgi:RNA polymerase sigma factor (sigma-70 family)